MIKQKYEMNENETIITFEKSKPPLENAFGRKIMPVPKNAFNNNKKA